MKRHSDSHLDHGLTDEQVAYLFDKLGPRDGFFIEVIELPENLGTVECGLHGPIMGDAPVPEGEVYYSTRGNRDGQSRMTNRPKRPTRKVTVIAGPHEGESCVLYTAFGGPLAPKEPFDPSLEGEELQKSKDFWAEHALSDE